MTREEAIQVVRGLTETTYFDDRELEGLRTLIPELTESEDERIRKMCITAVNIAASTDGGLLHHEASECLAWLEEQKDKNCLACDQHLKGYLAGRKVTEEEKQKENPKSADSIPSDCVSDVRCEDRWYKVEDFLPDNGRDVLAKDALGNYLIANYDGDRWYISGYDNEDKPIVYTPAIKEWCDIPSEKQKVQTLDLPAGFYFIDKNGKKYYSDTLKCGNLKFIANQKEQKPAEKQDYSGLNDLERAIHRGFLSAGVENVPVTIIKETAQECLAQIKPAEWSEEDKKMMDSIINELGQHYKTCTSRDCPSASFSFKAYQKEIDWLKSLRPHWKPSEHQLSMLEAVILDPNNAGAESCHLALESLNEDLQKLIKK